MNFPYQNSVMCWIWFVIEQFNQVSAKYNQNDRDD
jgi:hypothetical protein